MQLIGNQSKKWRVPDSELQKTRKNKKEKEEIVHPLVNQLLKVVNPTIHRAISQPGHQTISISPKQPSINTSINQSIQAINQ